LSVSISGTGRGSRAGSGAGSPRATSFGRHRRHGLAVHLEAHRYAADHVVGIGVNVERADVAPEPDGGALPGRRQQRTVLMLNLAEHDLAGARAECQRAQVIAVEAAHPFAERCVAERHRRLLDRGREHDIEADDLDAALDEGGQHLRDLARPGDGRRAFERRRAEGLLVDRDDHGIARRVRIAEDAPAQRGQNIDGQTAQRIEQWGGDDKARDERNDEGCGGSAQPGSDHDGARRLSPAGSAVAG
jgi:hypothetical protein